MTYLTFFLLILLTFNSHVGPATAYLNSTFQLKPGSSKWTNNEIALPTSINFEDGSVARFILLQERKINNSTANHSGFGYGFGFCFYCSWSTTDYDSCYLAIIFVEMSNGMILTEPPQVVWSANRDNPVGENATLAFSTSGNLVMFNSRSDTLIWCTNIPDMLVSGMRINEKGNLVMFNSTCEKVWQSFDHLTDTLLEGQILTEGKSLTSRTSAKNLSSGLFYLSIDFEAWLSAFMEGDKPTMYLSMGLNPLGFRFVSRNYFNMHLLLKFVEFKKGKITLNYKRSLTHGNKTIQVSVTNSNSTSIVHILRLDIDGGLRVYGWEPGKKWEQINIFKDLINESQFPLKCGRYGLYTKGGRCSCPVAKDGVTYFTHINNQFPELGCRQIRQASSNHEDRLVNFGHLSYCSDHDNGQSIPGLKDEASCIEACKINSSCKATFFRYDEFSSTNYCFLAADVLTLMETPKSSFYASSSYLKILIFPSNLTSNSSTSHSYYLSLDLITTFTCVLVVLMVIIVFMLVLQKKKIDDWLDHGFLQQISSDTPRRFSYDELCSATSNFSELLGQGGFGTVFKGVLKNGTLVAVKRLQTRHGTQGFLAEVETIGNIHHINLVRLVGFCASRRHRMLVYEYMSKGSLNKWLFCPNLDAALDWNTRKKIVIDIAKGLTYLHEECRHKIAHLDVKPHNILLDENFNAKLSDFGLSKLINRDELSQVVTERRGTLGYQAPEWQHSRISVKADVYSFGIVLLEIICGRKVLDYSQPPSDVHLLSLLGKKAFENQLQDMVDCRSEDMKNHVEEAIDMMRLGMWCSDGDYDRRPSMSTVVKILEGWMPLELIKNNFNSL